MTFHDPYGDQTVDHHVVKVRFPIGITGDADVFGTASAWSARRMYFKTRCRSPENCIQSPLRWGVRGGTRCTGPARSGLWLIRRQGSARRGWCGMSRPAPYQKRITGTSARPSFRAASSRPWPARIPPCSSPGSSTRTRPSRQRSDRPARRCACADSAGRGARGRSARVRSGRQARPGRRSAVRRSTANLMVRRVRTWVRRPRRFAGRLFCSPFGRGLS
jgi:hypothetical protein